MALACAQTKKAADAATSKVRAALRSRLSRGGGDDFIQMTHVRVFLSGGFPPYNETIPDNI